MLGHARRGWAAASLIAVVAGCGAQDTSDAEHIRVQQQALWVQPGEQVPVCPGPYTRWIGKSSAPCPNPADGSAWSKSRLVTDPLAPANLKEFCVYEWPSANPNPPKLGQLPTSLALDPDCFVVAPQSNASDVAAKVEPILTAAHLAAVEEPTSGAGTGAAPVDVAILDSWPSTFHEGRSQHGLAMAAIIDHIACGGLASCLIKTTPRLALDRFGPNATPSPVLGGNYGSMSKLASAIYYAVTAPGAPNRVLNVSLGWPGTYNPSSASPGQDSNGVQAVRRALELAACAPGVLVIAAAGNDTGGPVPISGPTYPGAWAQIPAPACAGARPLVFAVAGVANDDSALQNTRPGARSALAAPGFAVPSSKMVGAPPTPVAIGPITGSSVSTAVVSAIAAGVWNTDPGLSPIDVMARIYQYAEVLHDDWADFCLTPPCGHVRRVSVCRTLSAAGAMVTCGAPITEYTGSNPSYDDTTLADIAALANVTGNGVDLVDDQWPNECSIATDSLDSLSLGPAALCPFDFLDNYLMIPALGPEGETDPCPDCTLNVLEGGGVVEMPISDRITGTVSPQTLTLSLRGVVQQRIDLGSAIDDFSGAWLRDGMTAGSSYHVTLPPPEHAFDAASIEWTRSTLFTSSYLVITQ